MSVWTSSIPIEIGNHHEPMFFTVKVNEDFWIINDALTDDRQITLEFYHFSTELQKLFKVDIEFDFSAIAINHVASHGNQIFLVAQCRTSFRSVYRLDTETMKIELVKNLGPLHQPVAIIDNVLYNLDYDSENDAIHLQKLDLTGGRNTEKQIVVTPIPDANDYHLKLIDKNLYLLNINTDEKTRSVSKILNDRVELVHNDMFHGEAASGDVRCNMFDTFLTLETLIDEEQRVNIEEFDFESKKWIQQACLKGYETNKVWPFESALKMDGMIYMVFKSISNPAGYAIGILERQPDLTKICILSAIDLIIASGDLSQVDEFEKSLLDTLKQTARSMIHWRIREHEHLINRTENSSQILPEAEEAPIRNEGESQEMMEQ